jgi:hypothetical protein
MFEIESSFIFLLQVQWKPLNVITVGQIETDNINRMITITEFTKMYSVLYVLNKTWYIGSQNQDPKEH